MITKKRTGSESHAICAAHDPFGIALTRSWGEVSIQRPPSIRKPPKKCGEAIPPQPGCYYIVRLPQEWALLYFGENRFGEHGHSHFWENQIAEWLWGKWTDIIGRHRSDDPCGESGPRRRGVPAALMNPYAFPRGRIVRTKGNGRGGRFLLLHGRDAWDQDGSAIKPFGLSRQVALSYFGLTDGTCRSEYDEHERVIKEERDEIRTLLKIEETWRSDLD